MDSTQVEISVVTASYNYADYISETIESVLAQDFPNWEMIIVDDGSKDNSVDIIKQYCEKDCRIKLFQHKNGENKGLAETLKLGLSKAKGKWIAFLESDDFIDSEYMSEKLKVAKAHSNVNFIINYPEIFGNQKTIQKYNKYILSLHKIFDKQSYPYNLRKLFKYNDGNYIPTFSVVMLKKDLVKNLDFNSPIKPWLDLYLWYQIFNNKNTKAFYLNRTLTHWRKHDDSYVNSKTTEDEIFQFKLAKIFIMYYGIEKLFKILACYIIHYRKSIIKIHVKEGRFCLFGKWYGKQIEETI